MQQKPSSPQSPDSLLHPDQRVEVSEQDKADAAMVSAKEVRERYANLETRIDLAKGVSDEAKTAAKDAKEVAGQAKDIASQVLVAVQLLAVDVKTLSGDFKAFLKDDAEKDVRILTDMMMLMGSGTRVESRLDVLGSTLEATKLRVGRLDNENEANRDKIRESHESLRAMANDVRTTQTRLADKAAADRLDRARMEERFVAIKSDIAELKKDVTESGQHAAVSEAFARKSLDSVNDLGEITKIKVQETVEIKREGREDKRHLWKWALGLVGTLLVAGATYAATHWPTTPQPQTPAGAHS